MHRSIFPLLVEATDARKLNMGYVNETRQMMAAKTWTRRRPLELEYV